MYVDDLADALVFVLTHYSQDEHINIGVGQEVTISDLAKMIAGIVGLEGELKFDASKPDGSPRKLINLSRLFSLGWRPKTSLEKGLQQTVAWYLENGPARGHQSL